MPRQKQHSSKRAGHKKNNHEAQKVKSSQKLAQSSANNGKAHARSVHLQVEENARNEDLKKSQVNSQNFGDPLAKFQSSNLIANSQLEYSDKTQAFQNNVISQPEATAGSPLTQQKQYGMMSHMPDQIVQDIQRTFNIQGNINVVDSRKSGRQFLSSQSTTMLPLMNMNLGIVGSIQPVIGSSSQSVSPINYSGKQILDGSANAALGNRLTADFAPVQSMISAQKPIRYSRLHQQLNEKSQLPLTQIGSPDTSKHATRSEKNKNSAIGSSTVRNMVKSRKVEKTSNPQNSQNLNNRKLMLGHTPLSPKDILQLQYATDSSKNASSTTFSKKQHQNAPLVFSAQGSHSIFDGHNNLNGEVVMAASNHDSSNIDASETRQRSESGRIRKINSCNRIDSATKNVAAHSSNQTHFTKTSTLKAAQNTQIEEQVSNSRHKAVAGGIDQKASVMTKRVSARTAMRRNNAKNQHSKDSNAFNAHQHHQNMDKNTSGRGLSNSLRKLQIGGSSSMLNQTNKAAAMTTPNGQLSTMVNVAHLNPPFQRSIAQIQAQYPLLRIDPNQIDIEKLQEEVFEVETKNTREQRSVFPDYVKTKQQMVSVPNQSHSHTANQLYEEQKGSQIMNEQPYLTTYNHQAFINYQGRPIKESLAAQSQEQTAKPVGAPRRNIRKFTEVKHDETPNIDHPKKLKNNHEQSQSHKLLQQMTSRCENENEELKPVSSSRQADREVVVNCRPSSKVTNSLKAKDTRIKSKAQKQGEQIIDLKTLISPEMVTERVNQSREAGKQLGADTSELMLFHESFGGENQNENELLRNNETKSQSELSQSGLWMPKKDNAIQGIDSHENNKSKSIVTPGTTHIHQKDYNNINVARQAKNISKQQYSRSKQIVEMNQMAPQILDTQMVLDQISTVEAKLFPMESLPISRTPEEEQKVKKMKESIQKMRQKSFIDKQPLKKGKTNLSQDPDYYKYEHVILPSLSQPDIKQIEHLKNQNTMSGKHLQEAQKLSAQIKNENAAYQYQRMVTEISEDNPSFKMSQRQDRLHYLVDSKVDAQNISSDFIAPGVKQYFISPQDIGNDLSASELNKKPARNVKGVFKSSSGVDLRGSSLYDEYTGKTLHKHKVDKAALINYNNGDNLHRSFIASANRSSLKSCEMNVKPEALQLVQNDHKSSQEENLKYREKSGVTHPNVPGENQHSKAIEEVHRPDVKVRLVQAIRNSGCSNAFKSFNERILASDKTFQDNSNLVQSKSLIADEHNLNLVNHQEEKCVFGSPNGKFTDITPGVKSASLTTVLASPKTASAMKSKMSLIASELKRHLSPSKKQMSSNLGNARFPELSNKRSLAQESSEEHPNQTITDIANQLSLKNQLSTSNMDFKNLASLRTQKQKTDEKGDELVILEQPQDFKTKKILASRYLNEGKLSVASILSEHENNQIMKTPPTKMSIQHVEKVPLAKQSQSASKQKLASETLSVDSGKIEAQNVQTPVGTGLHNKIVKIKQMSELANLPVSEISENKFNVRVFRQGQLNDQNQSTATFKVYKKLTAKKQKIAAESREINSMNSSQKVNKVKPQQKQSGLAPLTRFEFDQIESRVFVQPDQSIHVDKKTPQETRWSSSGVKNMIKTEQYAEQVMLRSHVKDSGKGQNVKVVNLPPPQSPENLQSRQIAKMTAQSGIFKRSSSKMLFVFEDTFSKLQQQVDIKYGQKQNVKKEYGGKIAKTSPKHQNITKVHKTQSSSSVIPQTTNKPRHSATSHGGILNQKSLQNPVNGHARLGIPAQASTEINSDAMNSQATIAHQHPTHNQYLYKRVTTAQSQRKNIQSASNNAARSKQASGQQVLSQNAAANAINTQKKASQPSDIQNTQNTGQTKSNQVTKFPLKQSTDSQKEAVGQTQTVQDNLPIEKADTSDARLKQTENEKVDGIADTTADDVVAGQNSATKPDTSQQLGKQTTLLINGKHKTFTLHQASIKKSVRLNHMTVGVQGKQTVALCFEGLCCSVSQMHFNLRDDLYLPQPAPTKKEQLDARLLVRDSFVEALVSLRKATSNAVSILLYTFMTQQAFDQVVTSKPELAQVLDGDIVDRIIFLEGFRMGDYSKDLLAIPRDFLPVSTTELLWVHPLNIDFPEVLSRAKTKDYLNLLQEFNLTNVCNVSCLPYLEQDAAPQMESEVETKPDYIFEYNMLVSSLDFDLEEGKSASMSAIVKTIQSLYFLGKTTHLISTKKRLQQSQTQSLVPAAAGAVPSGLVQAPSTKQPVQSLEERLLRSAKPQISYSWQKSFKTVKEHNLLSLIAFEAPTSVFYPSDPKDTCNQANSDTTGEVKQAQNNDYITVKKLLTPKHIRGSSSQAINGGNTGQTSQNKPSQQRTFVSSQSSNNLHAAGSNGQRSGGQNLNWPISSQLKIAELEQAKKKYQNMFKRQIFQDKLSKLESAVSILDLQISGHATSLPLSSHQNIRQSLFNKDQYHSAQSSLKDTQNHNASTAVPGGPGQNNGANVNQNSSQANAQHQDKVGTGSSNATQPVVGMQSYMQPTISSLNNVQSLVIKETGNSAPASQMLAGSANDYGSGAVYGNSNAKDHHGHLSLAPIPGERILVQGGTSGNNGGLSGVISPRNLAKQFFKDMKASNRDIARHIKAYSRVWEQQLNNSTAAQNVNPAQIPKTHPNKITQNQINCPSLTNDQVQAKDIKVNVPMRKIMVLDGWLIEKYPLVKL